MMSPMPMNREKITGRFPVRNVTGRITRTTYKNARPCCRSSVVKRFSFRVVADTARIVRFPAANGKCDGIDLRYPWKMRQIHATTEVKKHIINPASPWRQVLPLVRKIRRAHGRFTERIGGGFFRFPASDFPRPREFNF